MSLLGGAGALAVALVLLAAGAGHLRDTQGLRRALAAHDVLPAGARRAVAPLLGPVELVLGAALLVSLATAWLPLVVALAAVLLTGAFTAYLTLVLRRTRGAGEIPCGCGLGTTPVGPWSVARAGLLAGLALLAVVGGTPDWAALAGTGATPGAAMVAGAAGAAAAPPLWAHVLLVVAAGTTLAIAVAALPAARAVPSSLTTLTALPAAPTTGGHR